MINSNATIAEVKSIHKLVENDDSSVIYSCVGENGMLCTRHKLHVIEGLSCLINPEVNCFYSESEARKFTYTRYLQKFFDHHNNFNIVSMCPKDFPTEFLWLDLDYELCNKII